MTSYVRGCDVSRKYNVSHTSLVRWVQQGKLRCITTSGGHRRYHAEDVARLFHGVTAPQTEAVIYARVSSSHQRGDLSRQVACLREAYPTHRLITDIGSGLNWHRRGFKRLLDAVLKKRVREVVVTHRDRLGRFAVDLLQYIFAACNCKLLVHNDQGTAASAASGGRELADDLMAVANFFVASHNGRRAAANRRARKRRRTDEAGAHRGAETKQESKKGAEEPQTATATHVREAGAGIPHIGAAPHPPALDGGRTVDIQPVLGCREQGNTQNHESVAEPVH